jgi:hypothetical protein
VRGVPFARKEPKVAEIIGMDELVPQDIEITYRGDTYKFPGDIDTETTFRLADMVVRLTRAEIDEGTERIKELGSDDHKKAMDAQQKLTLEVQEELLKLLQRNHPDLETFPFGAKGFQALLGNVLTQLGFGQAEPPDPPKPRPKMTTVKKKSRSKRSSSSRR